MRKREDGSIEIHDAKFIVVQEGFITVLKKSYELDGQLWTRLFRLPHIAVMDDGPKT